MQNNIFQLHRFYKLLKRKVLFQSKKSILFMMISYVGLPLLFLVIGIISGDGIDLMTRKSFFMLGLSVLFVFAPFHYFIDINEPRKGLIDAMLPASILEKYIMMQFSCIVIAPLLPFVLFGGTDWIVTTLAPNTFDGSIYSSLNPIKDVPWDMLMGIFVIQQLVLFFNMHFLRQKQIKTLGAIAFLQIAGLMFIVGLASIFRATGTHNIQITTGKSLLFSFSDNPFFVITQLTRIFTLVILPIVLVVISYDKLKSIKY